MLTHRIAGASSSPTVHRPELPSPPSVLAHKRQDHGNHAGGGKWGSASLTSSQDHILAQAGCVGEQLHATWCRHMAAEGQWGGISTSYALLSWTSTSSPYGAGHGDGSENAASQRCEH